MTLSEIQQRAVTRWGQDVCVVAGPGSGKTRVLVERFAWLVRVKKISPLKILAITFTDKAATEIKDRLAQEFSADPDLRIQIERAYVCTVHGFCARLLREHAIEAGLDPEFATMEEPESARLLEEAAGAVLDELYRSKPGQLRRLLNAIYSSSHPHGRQLDLAGSLIRTYDALRTAGRSASELRRVSTAPDAQQVFRTFLDDLEAHLVRVRTDLNQDQQDCIRALGNWLAQARRIETSPPSRKLFQLLESYPRKLPRKVLEGVLIKFRDGRREEVLSALAAEYYAGRTELLLDAVERLDVEYRRRKREASALDFADLEEQAIRLLDSSPAVRQAVSNRFEQILMDEMQDTNPLQWRLLERLRRPNRFFAVGDINQSIYGFRHAAPEVFSRYREQVRETGLIDELEENYRSRQEILDAARTVLSGAPGIEDRALQARRFFFEPNEGAVVVAVATGENAEQARQAEARWIAAQILSMVGKLTVQQRQQGRETQRPASFGDIAVLLRSLNLAAPFEQAFREFGIPFLSQGGKTFYETRPVRDLVLLLKVIANPADEAALAGVLRSPLVGVADQTLLRMRIAGRMGEVLFGVDKATLEGCDQEDLERLRRFGRLLKELRSERGEVSPDRLLVRVMDACDYEGGLDQHSRAAVENLLLAMRSWHDRHTGPLEALVEELEWRRQAEAEAEPPPPGTMDAVRIMTIHKAKGLEFPIVMLPALDYAGGRSGDPIQFTPDGRLGIIWRNPWNGAAIKDPAYVKAEQERKKREEAEENRLLYVAMTRAEQRLFVSFVRKQGKNSEHRQRILRLGNPIEIQANEQPGAAVSAAAPAEGELLVARPPLEAQHDSAVAVTSLDLFALCPRRYWLERYLGLNPAPPACGEPAGEKSALQFGSLVHELLAGSEAEAPDPEAAELVERFHASELGRRAARATRMEREAAFVMAEDDVVLRGQIDLWFEEGRELILVDYKTDQIPPEEASERAADYAVQLRFYALALEKRLGRLPNHAYIYFLRTNQPVEVALDEAALEQARKVLAELRDSQNQMQFDLRVGRHCTRCRFANGLCPATEA